MKKILTLGAALVAAVVLTFAVGTSHIPALAQQALTYSRTGNTAVGTFVGVYNVADSTLFDGELVMADTSTAAAGGLTRIGVKRFDGTALGRCRVVGIVAGDIPKSSLRGSGRVLIWGYHPAAYVGLSDLAANRPIKLGLINAMFQGADTLEAQVGYAISRTSAATSTVNTGPRYRYKVFYTGGNHVAGATL